MLVCSKAGQKNSPKATLDKVQIIMGENEDVRRESESKGKKRQSCPFIILLNIKWLERVLKGPHTY